MPTKQGTSGTKGWAERSVPPPPQPMSDLPAWESFTTADRRRLVQTILDVVDRQVSARATGRREGLGR
jgi:hypothetical protein